MSTTLSIEAQEQLARWSAKARALFTELLEDATGALQRELLQRSVAAGHTPAEVHAFADAIRGLDDSHAYAACTLEVTAPADFTVTQLLRAEADPLFAYELNGGALEPGDEPPAPAALEQPHPPRLDLLVAPPRRKRAFQADSGGVTPRLMAKPDAAERAPPPPSPLAFTEALLAEATRGLAVAWREHDVDARRAGRRRRTRSRDDGADAGHAGPLRHRAGAWPTSPLHRVVAGEHCGPHPRLPAVRPHQPRAVLGERTRPGAGSGTAVRRQGEPPVDARGVADFAALCFLKLKAAYFQVAVDHRGQCCVDAAAFEVPSRH